MTLADGGADAGDPAGATGPAGEPAALVPFDAFCQLLRLALYR